MSFTARSRTTLFPIFAGQGAWIFWAYIVKHRSNFVLLGKQYFLTYPVNNILGCAHWILSIRWSWSITSSDGTTPPYQKPSSSSPLRRFDITVFLPSKCLFCPCNYISTTLELHSISSKKWMLICFSDTLSTRNNKYKRLVFRNQHNSTHLAT